MKGALLATDLSGSAFLARIGQTSEHLARQTSGPLKKKSACCLLRENNMREHILLPLWRRRKTRERIPEDRTTPRQDALSPVWGPVQGAKRPPQPADMGSRPLRFSHAPFGSCKSGFWVILGVDSSSILCNHGSFQKPDLFPQGFGWCVRKKDAWKEWGRLP